MPNLWNDLTKWLEEASKIVGKEAGDLTLRGRLKLEIFEMKRKLRECFSELGSKVFEDVFIKNDKNWRRDRKITAIVKKIKGLQTNLKKKEKNYKRIGKKSTKLTKKKKKS